MTSPAKRVFPQAGLSGRRCLITGAGGGIGAATARRFCEEGAAVVLADLDFDAVEQLAEDLASGNLRADPLQLDVTDDGAVATAVAEAAKIMGGLDTLVPNAGILTMGAIDTLTPEAFRRTLEVNLTGTFLCIRHSVPHLREAGGGAIVCVASQSGLEGVPEATAYCASKFGVVGMIQSLARELTPEGIRVTGVAPGLIDTPMLRGFYEHRARVHGGEVDELLAEAIAEYPIGRLASPAEVADTIVFLASDLASYVSGATLPVIGGQVSR
jgi:NAD(P)-dependent dehydrogenase (short-subunit alcohol dehydrogenase family)